jgi:hypothetical protein
MSIKLSIWGTNGRINVDRQEYQIYLREKVPGPVDLPKGWTIKYITDLIEPVWYYLRGEEYSSQIDHFVRCIEGAVSENRSSFASAVKTDQVVASILRSADSGTIQGIGSASALTPRRATGFVGVFKRRLGLSA